QTSDHTACAVLRRTPILDEAGEVRRNHRGRRLFDYACVHLERFFLGTPYPAIVEAVKALLSRPELQPDSYIAVDATGVGRAVTDMFIDADLPATVRPITITGGVGEGRRDKWNPRSGPIAYWTPKTELV